MGLGLQRHAAHVFWKNIKILLILLQFKYKESFTPALEFDLEYAKSIVISSTIKKSLDSLTAVAQVWEQIFRGLKKMA